ncbi:hypothetical protein EN904_34155, partial [Mesorhizobium sp. M7A.F.Ca.CA.001.07.2.1]
MLAAGATEAVEEILGDVVAALHGDLLDGIGHVLHGDGRSPETVAEGFVTIAVENMANAIKKISVQ